MRAGSLDIPIELWQNGGGRDDWGQPIPGWAKIDDLWANVRFMNGREFVTANKESAETKVSFRIYDYAVNTGMQVRYDGKVYEITAALPAPRKGYMDLAAKEVI